MSNAKRRHRRRRRLQRQEQLASYVADRVYAVFLRGLAEGFDRFIHEALETKRLVRVVNLNGAHYVRLRPDEPDEAQDDELRERIKRGHLDDSGDATQLGELPDYGCDFTPEDYR